MSKEIKTFTRSLSISRTGRARSRTGRARDLSPERGGRASVPGRAAAVAWAAVVGRPGVRRGTRPGLRRDLLDGLPDLPGDPRLSSGRAPRLGEHHVPSEREQDSDRQRGDRGDEPVPAPAARPLSWFLPPAPRIAPSHGQGAYQYQPAGESCPGNNSASCRG